MANLSDHDLKQVDAAWLARQPDDVVRKLAARLLEDLKVARDRLNQGPGNSSRPPGSRDPWQRGTGKFEAADAADAAQDEGSVCSDAQAADAAPAPEGRASPAACGKDAAADPTTDPTKTARMAGEGLVPLRQQSKPAGKPGRRLGAPGHGRQQKLQATRIEEHRPSCCAACGQVLAADGALQAWSGWQTMELMPLGAEHKGALGVRIEIGARNKEMFNNGLSAAFAGMLMSDGYTVRPARPQHRRRRPMPRKLSSCANCANDIAMPSTRRCGKWRASSSTTGCSHGRAATAPARHPCHRASSRHLPSGSGGGGGLNDYETCIEAELAHLKN